MNFNVTMGGVYMHGGNAMAMMSAAITQMKVIVVGFILMLNKFISLTHCQNNYKKL